MYCSIVIFKSLFVVFCRKKGNILVEMIIYRLQGNCTMNCPKCKHQICLRNNSLKPKYIKVLRGRCVIEMSFDNLEKMEEWLAANYLDINPDGLPVVLEVPQKPTLTSTNSLLAPKIVCCALKILK